MISVRYKELMVNGRLSYSIVILGPTISDFFRQFFGHANALVTSLCVYQMSIWVVLSQRSDPKLFGSDKMP